MFIEAKQLCVKSQGVVAVLEHNSKLEGAVLPPFYCWNNSSRVMVKGKATPTITVVIGVTYKSTHAEM